MWDVLLNVHEVPQAERERILSFENSGVRPRALGSNEAVGDGVVLKFSSFAIGAKLQLGLYQSLLVVTNESAPKEESTLWFLHDSNTCYEIVLRDTQHHLVRCCLQRESSPKQ